MTAGSGVEGGAITGGGETTPDEGVVGDVGWVVPLFELGVFVTEKVPTPPIVSDPPLASWPSGNVALVVVGGIDGRVSVVEFPSHVVVIELGDHELEECHVPTTFAPCTDPVNVPVSVNEIDEVLTVHEPPLFGTEIFELTSSVPATCPLLATVIDHEPCTTAPATEYEITPEYVPG